METIRREDINFPSKFDKLLGFDSKVKWGYTSYITIFHIVGFWWCYLYAFPAKWQTVLFAVVMYIVSMTGVSSGVHRLWSHRSFKATLPLRIFLMLAFSSAAQYSIYGWVRDHRLHHKFIDSEADPYNPTRGFWFAHLGCFMVQKNKLVLEKGKQLDLSDIMQDSVAAFERKYSTQLIMMTAFVLPTITGVVLWGETWQCALAWQAVIRLLAVFHAVMSINSFAHTFGSKPYNKNISSVQNLFTSIFTLGSDGAHNFHHMFASDYKSAEKMSFFNFSSRTIKLWEKLGLAYDLKEANPELVKAVLDNQKQNEEKKFQ